MSTDGSPREAHGEFPPSALRQYALLADGERGALCGPHGEIVWMCAPRWHDDAIFSTLIGGRGAYAVVPTQRCVWGGHYEPGTLIWRNRWVTEDNTIIECRDALAMPSGPRHLVLLRRVEAIDGAARVQVLLDPRAAFGREPMRELRRVDQHIWTARSGPLYLRWRGVDDAKVDGDGRLTGTLSVPEGGRHDLILEVSELQLAREPVHPSRAWETTERAWAEDVPEFASSVAPRDTRHAYAVMRGLTSSGGGMVAAATMSLPERADHDRNYDYRYVWIRDQCYAGVAVAADGPHRLLHDAVRFVSERLLADGDQLKPAYRVNGSAVPDQRRLDLAGYPGAIDILGNHVNAQFQLDSLGESLTLFAAAARHDALDRDSCKAARVAVDAIERRWGEPDAGIWELDDDWWTHSRLACVAGLNQLAGVAPRKDATRFRELAKALLAETGRRCVHPDGYWQRSPADERVDAALLLPPVRGALPAGDPRTVATLDAVRRDLVDDGYVYRYAPAGHPLGEAEGAFLLCGFFLALGELQQGRPVDAFRWFERNRAACGPPGLLSEEFDVEQRQLRGNLPQAFVHALLLETSIRLAGAQ
ncbi:MAG: glycoside hydrolase family 15 protein [Jatrophihabitantaceae bacterium]